MVTWENYEEYMVQYADGELQPAEVQQLMAFLDKNPQLVDELALFEAATLAPDTTLVFVNKESLLKEEPASRVIAFPMWQRYSIAAGVAALLFVSFFTLWNKGGEHTSEMAQVQTPKPNVVTQVQTPKPAAVAQVMPATPTQPATGVTSALEQKEQPTQKEAKGMAASDKKKKKLKALQYELDLAVNMPKDYMEKLEEAPVATFAEETHQLPIAAIATPAVSLPDVKTGESKSFIDNLPIEDIKKEGVTDMINAVATTYKKINNIKHTITDEKNISVRVQKKQLILSF